MTTKKQTTQTIQYTTFRTPPAVKNNINCAKQLFGLDDKQ